MTWDKLLEFESNADLKKSLFDADLYIYEHNLTLNELCQNLGYGYFIPDIDLCLDEIVWMFNEMTFSRYSNNLTDFYTFVAFFFKRQLFNKNISVNEGQLIYEKYFKPVGKVETEFLEKLTTFKSLDDVGQDYVHGMLLQYFKDLKIQ